MSQAFAICTKPLRKYNREKKLGLKTSRLEPYLNVGVVMVTCSDIPWAQNAMHLGSLIIVVVLVALWRCGREK